jgi:hypothetical protein
MKHRAICGGRSLSCRAPRASTATRSPKITW